MSSESGRQKSFSVFTGIQSSVSAGIRNSEDFSEAVRRIFEDIKTAVSYFDYVKPSSSYVPKPVLESYMSRRTGRESLVIFKIYVPQTRADKTPDVFVIAAYRSYERPVEKWTFGLAVKYILRRIEEFVQGDKGYTKRIRIFFAGDGFRAGVEELAKRFNGEFVKNGEDISITLVDTRFEDVGRVIIENLATYLGSRAWGLIEKIKERKDTVKDGYKNFLDYKVLVLSRILDPNHVYRDCQDVAKRDEVKLSVYTNILEKLSVVKPKPKQREKRVHPETRPIPVEDRPLLTSLEDLDRYKPVEE